MFSFPTSVGRMAALFCLLANAIWLTGCGPNDTGTSTGGYEVADGSAPSNSGTDASDGSPTKDNGGSTTMPPSNDSANGRTYIGSDVPQPPVSPPIGDAAGSNFEIPEGKEELLAFVEEMRNRQPQSSEPAAQMAEFREMQEARLIAAEKLWELADDSKTRIAAAQVKLDVLHVLSQIGDADARRELMAYSRELLTHQDEGVAALGKVMLFGLSVTSLASGEVEDPTALMDQLKTLIAEDNENPGLFAIASQVGIVLQNLGFEDEALEAYKLVGNAYAKHEDPEIGAEAGSLLESAQLMEMGYQGKIQAMMEGSAAEEQSVIDALEELLSGDPPSGSLLGMAGRTGQLMEMTGHYEAAGKVYDLIQSRYAEHPEPELVEQAEAMVTNGTKRLDLLGQTLQISGETLDGTPLDWSQYEGKVLLVDFWSTESLQYLQEVPYVAQLHQKYGDQGFAVLGINLDKDADTVKAFFDLQPLPWETLVTADGQTQWHERPLALKYGVDTIPFSLLVGRDGKVLDLHTRGQRLAQKLEEQFGAAESSSKQPPSESLPPNDAQPSVDPPAKETPADADSSHFVPSGPAIAFVFIEASAADAGGNNDTNPYSPRPGISPAELVDFIFAMQDKPQSIQSRDGFAEAVVEAANRILAAESSDKHRGIAAQAKFEMLHKKACLGDDAADKQLVQFVKQMKASKNPKIAREVQFFELERRMIDADELALEQIPKLLADVDAYLSEKSLSDKHLRLASSVVRAVNRLDDGDEREKYFAQFGGQFAKSSDHALARYGKKLAKTEAASEGGDLAGQQLELEGTTALGVPFDWSAYRGKVVLIDFWATWCGPCRRATPHIKQLYEQLKPKGFDVVAVSLDKDADALAKYLAHNKIEWTNLTGNETSKLAAKYGIRAIPTMILVDQQGKIVASSHSLDSLASQAKSLLKKAEQ